MHGCMLELFKMTYEKLTTRHPFNEHPNWIPIPDRLVLVVFKAKFFQCHLALSTVFDCMS